jgi:putative transcriptional regulator
MVKKISSLKNKLLIAMPGIEDPFFEQSVTYICEHNKSGAMGIIINQPMDIKLGDILSQMGIPNEDPLVQTQPILAGGPVGPEQGFILHEASQSWKSTLNMSQKIALTTSRDILHDIAKGTGPQKSLVSLGCAEWQENQLERELSENFWLIGPARLDILFDKPFADRWEAALKLLGINPIHLCDSVGHA